MLFHHPLFDLHDVIPPPTIVGKKVTFFLYLIFMMLFRQYWME